MMGRPHHFERRGIPISAIAVDCEIREPGNADWAWRRQGLGALTQANGGLAKAAAEVLRYTVERHPVALP